MRANINCPTRPSFAELLDEEQEKEFREWFCRASGPWKVDLETYGPDYIEELDIEQLLGSNCYILIVNKI